MNLETFFEKFDLFADLPGAVARMRELVLHLAFSGKLVETVGQWPQKPLKSLTTKNWQRSHASRRKRILSCRRHSADSFDERPLRRI